MCSSLNEIIDFALVFGQPDCAKNVFSQLLEKLKLNKLRLSCAKLSSSLSKLSWLLPTSLHISFIGHSLISVSLTNFIGYPLSDQLPWVGWVGGAGRVTCY